MTSLTLVRQLAAPCERVYAAFTQAEDLRRWFGPGSMHVSECESDDRVGGQYRIRIDGHEGDHTVQGEYKLLQPHSKIIYSWQWLGSEDVSQVTISLSPKDGGTELVLLHEQLPNEESRAAHEQGWTGCLVKLPAVVEKQGAAT